MIAKITKGNAFGGAVKYIIDKAKETQIIAHEGLRVKNIDSVVQSFEAQARLNPNLSKKVGHTSLNFSVQDKDKLTNPTMAEIAREYMDKMGIRNTQYIIGRHFDKEHPHIHILYNRIDNEGKTISDRNDRFRSGKICKELSLTHGLYIPLGKRNVKINRLREPDRSRYQIYKILEQAVSKSTNWKDLIEKLEKQEVKTSFKYKGQSEEIQGVTFEKNGFRFSGSKVDQKYSYSKIDNQLQKNIRGQNANYTENKHFTKTEENNEFHNNNQPFMGFSFGSANYGSRQNINGGGDEDIIQKRKRKRKRRL